MFFKIHRNPQGHLVYLLEQAQQAADKIGLPKQELQQITEQFKNDETIIEDRSGDICRFFVRYPQKGTTWQTAEALRKLGAELQKVLQKQKVDTLTLANLSEDPMAAYHLAEGITLASYQFLKYKTDAKKLKYALQNIFFSKGSIPPASVNQLQVITDAIFHVRNLVNEPLQFLTAEQFAKEITEIGKEGRFRVQVLGKAKIEQLNMGGLLAVNRGSVLPPTFTVMEHRPQKAYNKHPIVLVGKGIVYDTGGLSLKPTKNSMDKMKSDMSGGALVAGLMYVAGQLDLPLHLIGLVPATENRPGQNAYVPGDVIKMYSGATVEVLNTDAEGRLVLADALHYAQKYRPELVLDFATLTGAAANAIGEHGIVYMGTADDAIKKQCEASGYRQYERLVAYPLWEEYGAMIQSQIADLKNVGGPGGGAIIAGKFLEYFTDYPWLHFDIAGVSFQSASKDYRPYGGTACGLRLITDFLIHYGQRRP